MATTVPIEGRSLVNPQEYFIQTTQATSKTPATTSKIQFIKNPQKKGGVPIEKKSSGVVPGKLCTLVLI